MPKRYTGILAKPLVQEDYSHKPTLAEGGGPRTWNTEALARDLAARLKALYDCYEIDPHSAGADMQLILTMAQEFVPGFRIVSNRDTGVVKRTKWEPWRLSALLAAVELLKQGGMTERGAIKHIASNSKYKNVTLGTKNDRLREMYFKARDETHNPLAPLVMVNPKLAEFLFKKKFPIR